MTKSENKVIQKIVDISARTDLPRTKEEVLDAYQRHLESWPQDRGILKRTEEWYKKLIKETETQLLTRVKNELFSKRGYTPLAKKEIIALVKYGEFGSDMPNCKELQDKVTLKNRLYTAKRRAEKGII